MNRIYLNVIRRWSRYIDKFFVNSLDVFTDLTRCGISKEKITIVNNWVEPIVMDEDNIKHLNEKYRYLLNYKFRVIYVGRLVEYKHVLTYANVASRLANNFIAFIFVGYGELSGLIEKIKNCNSNIFWLSNISNEELRYLMSISNITLAYADENYLGLTAYESLMCGTPVIYIDISCSPAKYFKKIKIEKELLPTHIGYKVGEKEDDICNLITLLYELNKPTIKEREECKIYATKFHSEKNAEILLNETLKYPIGSIE
ncbi:MAG: glycosyltransferase [Candidatus Nitrosocaldaceae archaeon]